MAVRRAGGSAVIGRVKIAGLKEIQDKLKTLEPKIAKKVVHQALKKAAEPILHAARSKAPVDTGLLVSSLKTKASTSNRKGTMTVRVQTSKGDYKGEDFYASFIEFGHHRGKRKTRKSLGLPEKTPKELNPAVKAFVNAINKNARPWVPPQPFMRPAYDENKEQALQILTREIIAGVEREAVKK